ncbi:MAG: CoA-transferase [Geminicoccaceae bacterium]
MAEPERLLVMIGVIARLLRGLRHVAVGASSPVPAAAALVAREQGGGRPVVSILGSESSNPFTDGGRELFDCAAQGRLDAFFLSGAQIDATGAVNLLGLGEPGRMRRRFMGNFGAPYLASLVPNVILFRTDHGVRTLVEKVDFVTAPGVEGRWLVTDRAVFRRQAGRLRLVSWHAGEMAETVRAATGFAFETAHDAGETPGLEAAAAAQLRGPVGAVLREVYPAFAAQLT